jgi:Tol biopolymer transport system component
MTGQTITHYEVLEKLGGGGMGVVYRARDLHLNRFVALKFLAPELTRNDGAKRRFIQEAQAASALDHSNICTIHEIAETPEGQSFIVMACYEGETLKDRIERGPLKLDEALDIAIGIGTALVAAHESGIVHRDIKPANVMLTRRSEVKVVDFGLAKLIDEFGITRTSITQPGTTVGTVAYMSPDQTLGAAVDQRTDIWALGVVLYEMVSGRRPFDGGQPASILHAVAHEQPAPLTSLRTGVPIDLDRIVMRALAKQPNDRYQSAADLVSEVRQLRHASDRAATAAEIAAPARESRWTWRSAAFLIVALLALGAGAAYVFRGRNVDRAPTFANLVQVTSAIGVEDYPTWSPDGRTLAYEAGDVSPTSQSGNVDIWVTQVGGGAAINRTADHQGEDRFPVWSPDGRQIAFWSSRDGGGCFVMLALAGAPRKTAASGQLFNASRPQWSADGTKLACVAAPSDSPNRVGVDIISLGSGEAKTIALPGDGRRFDLAWSADGRSFAYVSSPAGLDSDVSQLLMLRAGDDKAVAVTDGRTKVRGPFWSADGRWLYYVTNREGAMDIWRQSFTRDGTLAGPPGRVTTGLEVRQAAVSADGAKLAYSKGRSVANVWSVPILSDGVATWADAHQVTFDHALIEFLDLSPDGRTLAVSSDRSGNQDVWLMPADGGEMRPITTDPTPDWAPRWSPDGKQMAFYSYRSGNRDIWILPLEGGPARQLTHDPAADLLPRWSSNGREIVFLSGRRPPGGIWIVQATGGEPKPIENLLPSDSVPVWSSDGQWIAFSSARADGVPRVWRAHGDGTNIEQVTTGSARDPIWSRNGQQLFFPGLAQRAGNVWAISLADRHERPVTALTGRLGNLMPGALATDGHRLFFSWQENIGDIWVMDVTNSRPE